MLCLPESFGGLGSYEAILVGLGQHFARGENLYKDLLTDPAQSQPNQHPRMFRTEETPFMML